MAEEMPKWSAQRIFILVMVIVFFISSFGLTGLVVWQQVTAKDDTSNIDQAAVNKAISDAKNKTTGKENAVLQGTQLSDFTPVGTVSKLQKTDIKEGTGKEASATSSVTVQYTGAVAATGTIFQSSIDTGQPATFGLDQVIAGWKEGIPGMKEGGTRRLVIPADKAYGANPPANSGIPANAPLVFDVVLITVN